MKPKTKNIVYWIATLWLCLGMVSTGIVQLLHIEEEVKNITSLGYPEYFLSILGTWKLLGVIAVLLPRTALLKEWAYAGFFFAMTGATISRILSDNSFTQLMPSILLLALTIISWYLRPNSKKLI